MKRLLIPLTFLVVITAFSTVAFFWWKEKSKPASNEKTLQRFVIPKGYSASQIGNKLKGQGLIKDALAFKFYVQVTGKAKKIQAGEFRLSSSLSLFEVVDTFTKGPVELWVTVPEGLRREEVVERFVESLEMDGPQAATFREEFLQGSTGKEGFLFPDTYLFPRTASASAVISAMLKTFDKRVAELQEDIEASSFNINEIITLASVIERETKTEEERPIVAGILLNRLEIDMGLQADATVQYAVATENCKLEIENCPDWWPILTKEDLKINSFYNSYKYRGLSPGPIANPGFSSIRTVVNPERNNYLYYLHDAEGQIHYAQTLEEHNENVRKYLGK